ncbi:MAG: septal ring lytic transglycosylase RlpA family protein [Pseudomonadota bacterium]
MIAAFGAAFVMAGCLGTSSKTESGFSPRVVSFGQAVPKGGGRHKLGKPYFIKGRRYVPQADQHYNRVGIASWYGKLFHGRMTANGEVYDMGALTAAHPTLPLPSYVHVTNLSNGRDVIVRVNDRGPYAHDRIIDMSREASRVLGFNRQGTARVRVRYLGPAPIDGNDAYERRFIAKRYNVIRAGG